MNGTRALLVLQDLATSATPVMNVLVSYIVRTQDGEYHVVVADRMEELQGQVGFYTVDDISGTYKLLDFIGLVKDRGVGADYATYLERKGYRVVARYRIAELEAVV